MANITLEAVEAVMEQAGAEFAAAKKALLEADGDVALAVRSLTEEKAEDSIAEESVADGEYEKVEDTAESTCGSGESEEKDSSGEKEEKDKIPVDDIVAKLKAAVKTGNVDRIVIRRKDDILLNIPVNVGLVGSLIAFAAAPWAMITAAVAAYGLSCRIEIIHKDGTKEEV